MTKNQLFPAALFATVGMCLLAGCSEKSETAPAASANAVSNVTQQASITNLAITKIVAAVALKDSATNAVVLSAVPTNAVVTAASTANQLLEQAKALVAGQKYTEAASLLGSVDSQKLTGEQTSLWQSLQAQVQKALTAQTTKSATESATKTVGGLLGK